MDYDVVLSDLFIADLEEITAYLKRRASPELAFRIGNELIDRALELGKNPFVGQIVKRQKGTRKILRYSYRIYYDVNEVSRVVEVLRVGMAREILKRFGSDSSPVLRNLPAHPTSG